MVAAPFTPHIPESLAQTVREGSVRTILDFLRLLDLLDLGPLDHSPPLRAPVCCPEGWCEDVAPAAATGAAALRAGDFDLNPPLQPALQSADVTASSRQHL